MGVEMADRKRPRPEDAPMRKKGSLPPTEDGAMEVVETEDLEFEDPFEDEVEEDDIITEEEAMALEQEEEDEEKERVKVWRPNIDQLAEDEVLEYDNTAYDLFHVLRSDWPCLSVDIIPDKLGHQRTKYPHTVYFAAGTQAADPKQNKIFIFKATELHRTRHDDEEDDEEDDDYKDDDPVLESRFIKHDGCVNRLRVMPQKPNILASWSDKPAVNIWDISQDLRCLENPQRTPTTRPLTTFRGHPEEGYALDWSPVSEGRLLTGDCSKFIYLWSPSEDNVFASCSVDQTIRIWDIRKKNQSALCVKAHDSDVNVISWNKIASHALLSGADD